VVTRPGWANRFDRGSVRWERRLVVPVTTARRRIPDPAAREPSPNRPTFASARRGAALDGMSGCDDVVVRLRRDAVSDRCRRRVPISLGTSG
jgi:hypothetical protein